MNRASDCKARQYSDEMVCSDCGLRWDVNDTTPPRCAPRPVLRTTHARHVAALDTRTAYYGRVDTGANVSNVDGARRSEPFVSGLPDR